MLSFTLGMFSEKLGCFHSISSTTTPTLVSRCLLMGQLQNAVTHSVEHLFVNRNRAAAINQIFSTIKVFKSIQIFHLIWKIIYGVSFREGRMSFTNIRRNIWIGIYNINKSGKWLTSWSVVLFALSFTLLVWSSSILLLLLIMVWVLLFLLSNTMPYPVWNKMVKWRRTPYVIDRPNHLNMPSFIFREMQYLNIIFF